jgi:hypothetical protein
LLLRKAPARDDCNENAVALPCFRYQAPFISHTKTHRYKLQREKAPGAVNSGWNISDIINVRLFISVIIFLFAAGASGRTQESAAPADRQQAPQSPAQLPGEFFGISLNDALDSVKDGLKGHPYFFYRGDPDVSFLPQTTKTVIDCEGRSYVKRGLFQFSDERLYIITVYLDPGRVDYFSLFSALTGKYGRPDSLSPQAAVWQNSRIRLSLEKPLTIKYNDRETFDKLKSGGETQKSLEEQSRRRFLDSF